MQPEEAVMKAAIALSVVAVVGASSAFAGGGWKVVKRKSVGGQFAVTAVSATVRHPSAVGVRLLGRVDSGTAVVACSKGFSVSSNSRSYRRAGTYKLPMMRNPDRCDITASVGGSGRVTVQILKK
jgi:hypothetical protein